MAARVQQRLREMACVAFLLRNRERMKELLDAGDHAAFEQQAPQLFGAGVHIPQLVTAVQTQTSFYAWLSMRILNVGGVTGVTIRGVSDARRAKQRRNFLFLAREGADDSFAMAHPRYFLADGDLDPGPNGELFDAFAEWTMREHPDWTLISHIDDHCGRKEPWVPPEWVSFIVAWVLVAAVIAFLVFSAAVVVGRFPRDLERVQAIKGLAKMSQVHYDTVIQKSTDLLGSVVRYGTLAGVWSYTYHHTTGRTKECSLWITGIFVSIAVCLFGLIVMAWALVAL
jgi:hypothetical protein